ncbi:MAG TPA: IPT/TIG domain-containing protein [Chryseolinea sp.]|nr:IPT/TIG domain-containing protein [Chryseolinea sp.]
MNKIILIVLLGSLTINFSCDDEDEAYPQVETTEVIPSSASNFVVKGNITATGNSLVLEYGFVYSLAPTPDVFQGTKEAVGNTATTGPFEKSISLETSGGATTGYTVFVRAYLTNQKGTVYGVVKEFTIPALNIVSVAPLTARTGEQITITGQNFGVTAGENVVTFNEVEAEIVSASATSLVVKVPSGMLAPSYNDVNPIVVTTGGQTVTATESFRLLPTVADFSPKNGTFGTIITVTGSDFYPFQTSALIGGKPAAALQVTDTYVTFMVPLSVTSPTLKVKVITGATTIDVPGDFIVTPPTITSVSPLIGLGGTIVIIKGTGFNLGDNANNYNVVKFGSNEAESFNSGVNEITAYVPKGLPLGNYQVSVFTGIHTVAFANQFTLTKPAITGFSPTSGIAGTYVTITGTNFGELDPLNSVLFGTNPVDIYSWVETSITVYIPIGTPSGSVKITINASGQTVTSANNFTIN